ncbi:MAG TPA: hypothetical protein VHP63_00365, partial [candidate division Zixibacteria bacterium]|nr:hypothetical protein [candidate division Zixibacteria bacterium]
VGAAGGVLIGLQFIVLTLMAGKPLKTATEAGAAFSTPSVVHFSAVLFLSAFVCAPWQSVSIPAVLWGIMGAGGIIYSVLIAKHVRKQAAYEPKWDDWFFRVIIPFAAYALLVVSAFTAENHIHAALFEVGASSLVLMFLGIHNSWDNIAFHVFVNNPYREGQSAGDSDTEKESQV